MQYLRQSTASQEISLGQFLDSTDGNTEENGLTIANTDIKLRKGGTTTLANKNSGGATSISNGVYHATLDATDSNTLGMLEIYVHVAGALAVKNTYMVIPSASYDAIVTNGLNDIAATAIVSAGAINTSSGAVTTVTTATNLTNLPSIPANWLTAAGIASSALNGKGNWNIGKTGYSLTQAFPANFADLDITVTTGLITVGTNNDKTGYSISGTITTLDGLNNFNPATEAVANVTLVATTTTNTDMRGTDSAFLAASAPTNFSALGINVGGDISVVTLVGTTTANTDMRGTDSALLAASINLTAGAVDVVTLVTTTATNTDMRGTDGANTVVPDAAGVAPTAVEIRQEMDANSVDLNTLIAGQTTINTNVLTNNTDIAAVKSDTTAILIDTGTTLPALINDLAVKKNTAFSNFEFLMVLTSDGRTPATGLTVTGERSVNGGAFSGVAGAIAEVSNGIYQFDALAADTNGDLITWRFSSATADDTFVTFKTVA